MSIAKEDKKIKAVVVKEKRPTTPYAFGKALSKYGLTTKQQNFVIEYIKNGGNGTKAALLVCDCKSDSSAAVSASEFLSLPKVREAIQAILYKQLATPDAVASKMVQLMHDARSEDTQLRAADSLSRVLGMAQRERATTNTVNFNILSPALAHNDTLEAFATVLPDTSDPASMEE